MPAPASLRCALAAAVAALLGCGGDGRSRPPPAPPAAMPSTAVAQPRAGDDLVVATVAGQPVYGSCVEAQARHLGLTARAALDQCIDFELLAQAAEARGLRGDPDVAEAWRREMVRAIVRTELTPMDGLEDLPASFREPLMAKRGQFLHRPVIRISHFVMVVVPKKSVIDGPEDQAAHAVADAIYAELGEDEGVLPDELHAAANRHADGLSISLSKEPYPTPEHTGGPTRAAVPAFRQALYAIPAIGRISPPARTQFGWTVILWWDTWPEADFTPSLFEHARQSYSQVWADQLARSLGMERWIDEELLTALVEVTPAP